MNTPISFHSLKSSSLFYNDSPLPAVAFALIFVLAIAAGLWKKNDIHRDAELEFQHRVVRLSTEVERRLQQPIYGLNGAKGLYAANQNQVSRAKFRTFIESRDLSKEYPGVRGFGFIQQVQRADLGAFVAAERADGAPEFAIRQLADTDLDDLYVIKLIEPLAQNSAALGLDIGSEALRRAAAQQAIDTGEPTSTGAIALVQGQHKTPGFLMYLPLYAPGARPNTVQERRTALVGLLYAPILFNELLGGMPDVIASHIDFDLLDNTDSAHGQLLYDPDQHAASLTNPLAAPVGRRFSQSQTLVVLGRKLSLRVNSTAAFDAEIDTLSPWFGFTGITFLGVLLAFLLRQQISGRRRAELRAQQMTAQLRHDEERARDFSSCASDWCWETDAQHNFRFFSDNFEQVYGLSPMHLLGKPRTAIPELKGLNPPEVINAHFAQLETHQPFKDFEYQMRDNNAHLAWMTVSGQPYFDAEGGFLGYRGIGANITARKQTEAALLKAGALQRAIFDSANFSSIATDAKGVIQIFNVGAERMLGYTAAEVMNQITPAEISDSLELIARAKTLSAELATDISPGFEALVFKACHGIEDIYELTYIRKDGSRLPAVVSVTALRDAQDAIIGYLLIGTDNTARKHIEEDRLQLAQALQAQNVELDKARVVAVKANQAKSEFLSSMSHELRTPLNAILGFSQMLESGSPPPTPIQQKSLEQILKGGWYLLSLINEILDLALVESGKLKLQMTQVSLAGVMNECEAMVEPQTQHRRISVRFDKPEAPVCVHADPTRLKQVFINLLSNAIKYNQVGGTIAVRCTHRTGDLIRISVQDTGEGLNAEQMTQLFQPFNRLGRMDSGEEGTGIGLVMCKRLVELMGGAIGVDSTVGEGSVFWFELSRSEPSQSISMQDEPVASVKLKTPLDAQDFSLLYVEDNPANLLLVELLIERRPNIRFLSAIEALEGIELARTAQPDVILMDINLPGMSGIEALKILRADAATAHIPVVALSANANPHDIERGLQAGFFAYLTKPLKVEQFMSTLDAALKAAH